MKKMIGIIGAILIVSVLICFYFKGSTDSSNKSTSAAKTYKFLIYIEIEDKTLYVLHDNKCVRKYPISSGSTYSPSPLGCWKITDKADWGEGFGGRWMGLNVPWGHYGIHGTLDPGTIGYNSSAGCIRLYNEDVKELYNIIPIGTTVVIVNGTFGPFGTGFKDIEVGDRGADVMSIQLKLKDLGYFKGWVSGIYEDDLKYALHKFQKDNGMEARNTITKKVWLKMGFKEFE